MTSSWHKRVVMDMAMTSAVALSMSACSGSGDSGSVVAGLGDPESATSIAPLEVVLASCTLNRDKVAPGDHEVALVGSGTVVVTDPSGAEVLRLSQAGSLTTRDGTYTFTCTASGADTGTATLTSRT